MSQENVELTQRVYDAFNRRDLDALLALMRDDVEAVSFLAAMEGKYHGHDGMRRWYTSILEIFPDCTIEASELRDLGARTLVQTRLSGEASGSGLPLEQTIWQLIEWREGKIAWWRTFPVKAEALKAAGLSE